MRGQWSLDKRRSTRAFYVTMVVRIGLVANDFSKISSDRQFGSRFLDEEGRVICCAEHARATLFCRFFGCIVHHANSPEQGRDPARRNDFYTSTVLGVDRVAVCAIICHPSTRRRRKSTRRSSELRAEREIFGTIIVGKLRTSIVTSRPVRDSATIITPRRVIIMW